jgi:hypothetical protein
MKTPLFKQEANKAMKMETSINNGEEEIYAKERLEVVIIESLTRIEKLSITSGIPSMASLRGMARKK